MNKKRLKPEEIRCITSIHGTVIYKYCFLCGTRILNTDNTNMEHLLCSCQGGTTTPDNLLLVHSVCNSIRGCLSYDIWFSNRDKLLKNALKNFHLNKKNKKTLRRIIQTRTR